MTLTRREMLRKAAGYAAVAAVPGPLLACAPGARDETGAASADSLREGTSRSDLSPPTPEDLERLRSWVATLRAESLIDTASTPGAAAARVGELAAGTPYEAYTLEEYLRAGGSPMRTEPLTLHLDRFDCVSLVEACLAVARVARAPGEPRWEDFAREMERMRYRGGERGGYTTRLHYFSEWMSDGAARGLVQILGEETGGRADTRPLRFMSSNPDSYPALSDPAVLAEIAEIERSLDTTPRWVIPTAQIDSVSQRIRTGDVLAFATSIEGLDVTHSAFAYRDGDDVLRVLHAPLSGGVVEVTRSTLPEYVAAIRTSTGILLARPLWG